jgi:hypothetical protein
LRSRSYSGQFGWQPTQEDLSGLVDAGVVRHRRQVLAAWLVLFILGGLGAANLGGLLSNRFSVPGSDAETGLTLLQKHFGERGDGSFTLVARPTDR